MTAAWVIVVLLTGQPPEIVSGDYPTKATCENTRRMLEPQQDWSLKCMPRRAGMKNHQTFLGD
jgi:hypothetical protein